jgi:hypothetical protein
MMFERLQSFRREHGHGRVPTHYAADRRLGNWLSLQRQWAVRGTLAGTRRQRLLALGVVFKPLATHWDNMLAGLDAFQWQHAHTRVPRKWNEPRGLGGWVALQRYLQGCGRLSATRVRCLKQRGFDFGSADPRWHVQYARLVTFQKEHGHCNVRSGDAFGQWVYKQRKFRRQGKLDGEKIQRLDAIGFEWVKPGHVTDFIEARWARNVGALAAFKKKHGHCRVPDKHNRIRRGLGVWVANVRKDYHDGRLTPERIATLESLGFVWNCDEDRWRQWMERLRRFKEEFGHVNVPSTYRDRPLANFIMNVRKRRRQGKLSKARIRTLNEMGLTWNFKWQASGKESQRPEVEG